jgi:hypothetical protein
MYTEAGGIEEAELIRDPVGELSTALAARVGSGDIPRNELAERACTLRRAYSSLLPDVQAGDLVTAALVKLRKQEE